MSVLLFNQNDFGNYSDAELLSIVEHDIILIGQKHFDEVLDGKSEFHFGYDIMKVWKWIDDLEIHFEIRLPDRCPIYKLVATKPAKQYKPFIDGLRNFKTQDLTNCVIKKLQNPDLRSSFLYFSWREKTPELEGTNN